MNKPLLVFQAPVATRSGYGDHARDILKSLRKLDKFDIKIVPTRWGATPQNQLNPDDEFHMWILNNVAYSVNKRPDVFVQMSVANEFQPMGTYSIGITAGVETTLTPQDFITGANKMNLIITPSEFTKDGFVRALYQQIDNNTKQVVNEIKCTTPIEILFEGIDTDIFKKLDSVENSPIKDIETDFNFLFVGHWLPGDIGQDRKDIGMMIKTFCGVFKSLPKDQQPGLILKTSLVGFSVIDREEVRKRVDAITREFGDKCPPIYLVFGDLLPAEMNKLYNDDKVKAMVSFTKGEGYGRPLAEFAVTGKPILVSNWSGPLDFLPKEYTTYLDGELTEVHPSAQNKFLLQGSKWYTVNYSKAAQKMYEVFKNYDSNLKRSSKLNEHIIEKFSIEAQDVRLKEIFDEYVKVKEYKPLQLPEIQKL